MNIIQKLKDKPFRDLLLAHAKPYQDKVITTRSVEFIKSEAPIPYKSGMV